MSSFVTFDDAFYSIPPGVVPRGSVRTVDGDRWVCSYETWQQVPSDAVSYKDEEVSESSVDHCATRILREWGRDPDWYTRATFWRGFIPAPSPVSPGKDLWFYCFDEIIPFLQVPFRPSDPNDKRAGFQIPPATQNTVIETLKSVFACTQDVLRAYPMAPQAYTPLEYPTHRVKSTHASMEGLLQSYGIARRTVLDHLGFILWRISFSEDWQSKLSDDTKACIAAWHLTSLPRRGFLIDPIRDWREVNLPFWIYNLVPVFWRWTDLELSEPRLARLSPQFLQVIDYDAEPERTPLLTSSFQPTAPSYPNPPLPGDPLCYDKYLQLRHFDTKQSKPAANNAPGSLPQFVIDFEEWFRRPVTRREQKVLYRRFYFEDVQAWSGRARIFYRARPIQRPITSISHQDDDDESEDGYDSEDEGLKDTLLERREIGRFESAPWRDQTPEYQGVQAQGSLEGRISSPSVGSAGPSAVSRPPSSRSTSASSRRARAEQRDPYPRGRRGAPAQRPLAERIQITSSLQHRLTSPQPTDHQPAPSRYASPSSLMHIPAGLEWDLDVQRHGILFIPVKSTEVRLRYWSLKEPTLSPLALLRRALERCLEFSIDVPRDVTHLFAPPASITIPESISIYYEPDYKDERMSSAGTGRDIVMRYRNLILGLLARPHARGFIFQGGINARIAWQFGGPALIRLALQGPSIQITRFNRGFTRLTSQTCSEMIAKYEEDVLLGRFPAEGREDRRSERSLWPPPKYFNRLLHWRGEWNSACEEFFQTILQELLDDSPRLRSQGDWDQYIRTYNRRHPPATEPLSNAEWDTLSHDFTTFFQSSWNGTPVRNLEIPEGFESAP
ncbi:hypothetical protein PLICRDRAFT_120217 [Plicaturopsis crispa FD-325 SS-3]|uniref:Uncharacterized protein n=1 Tax=Plicaturopsis crispa FD-325 SS-3 TaxID=944288 RepID=A0A0C9SV58_PLICR|nr:hypothetical protein PLICRDRAFT_120217 [Plicaturopsis crispa FD-325 SS-3]